jgi:LAGLIDADG DNA endonuclease family protein
LDKPKTQVILRFKLTQHIRDEELFSLLTDYLDCGKIYVDERSVSLIVTKFSDLSEKIVPLFDKYPVQGLKRLNYADFVKVWQLMKNRLHLTTDGVKLIRKIKSGMNFGRILK